MDAAIIRQCEQVLDSRIEAIQPVGGGDINEARLLRTSKGLVFLKYNTGPQAAELLEAEMDSLSSLAATNTLKTPKLLGFDQVGSTALLLLEYISPGHPKPDSWQTFGRSLAELHRCTQDHFGYHRNNFIGRLPQSNDRCLSWPEFYQSQRLAPQLALAVESNLISPATEAAFEQLYTRLDQLCPQEPPALIHGDLWSGNFLINANHTPYLIDPSVSYAHREMDLAMAMLFGGFDPLFYKAYDEVYPLERGFRERAELYQLYYLLAHVNLFGWSYVAAVERILRRFVE